MPTIRQADPRANQKARTRAAIVEAAQRLNAAGDMPTVAEAAHAAGVSRATAYRYFPTQEALRVELADVSPAVVSVEALLEDFGTNDVEERLLLVLDRINALALEEEAEFRQALWVYLDTWLRSHRGAPHDRPAVREGRRMRWLDAVLEPLTDVPAEERRRLSCALALTVGSDSLVVMKDVCHLEDDEALAVLRWAATAILRAGLEQPGDS